MRDAEFGWPPEDGDLWEVEEVRYGVEPHRELRVCLNRSGVAAVIEFEDPVSFRAQDEREMLSYWEARNDEKPGNGTIYTIGHSAYLDEIAQGVTGGFRTLTHYLVRACDLCVEVITYSPPSVSMSTASEDGH